jgi:hypothetical protein
VCPSFLLLICLSPIMIQSVQGSLSACSILRSQDRDYRDRQYQFPGVCPILRKWNCVQ